MSEENTAAQNEAADKVVTDKAKADAEKAKAKEVAKAKADAKKAEAKEVAKAKADAKKAAAKSKKPIKPKKYFATIDGQKYKVADKFRFLGTLYTAEDAVKDGELMATLADAESFVLTKV